MLLAALDDAGLTPHTPAGAYYILADAGPIPAAPPRRRRARCSPRPEWPRRRSAFYRAGSPAGENLLRFCFSKKDADLAEAAAACARIRNHDCRAAIALRLLLICHEIHKEGKRICVLHRRLGVAEEDRGKRSGRLVSRQYRR